MLMLYAPLTGLGDTAAFLPRWGVTARGGGDSDWIEATLSMDSVGVHTLSSAAAQGGQDTSNEHANGSPFTGWDSGVQASQDAPCQ